VQERKKDETQAVKGRKEGSIAKPCFDSLLCQEYSLLLLLVSPVNTTALSSL
jgi:hypothetical protein